jgi:hypothetical protein
MNKGFYQLYKNVKYNWCSNCDSGECRNCYVKDILNQIEDLDASLSNETTGTDKLSKAIAKSDIDICSPDDSNISISRFDGRREISFAFSIKRSVISPCADTTTTTSFAAS